ncbi:carbohydrate porin, partial [Escherichia coli]|nr:carbohydrate porin [Escherichia coli]
MKKSTLSLAIGLLLACSTGMAKTQHLTLEQRMALLEERLEAAEMRAAKAEGQVKQLQTQQAAEIREIKAAQGNTPVNGQTTAESAKKNATSPNLLLSGYGDLKIYGDVEFNMDAESNHGLLAMTNADVNSDPTNEQWNLNG